MSRTASGFGYTTLPETSVQPTGACQWCSSGSSWTIHAGACPKVAAIEYHKNGTVKRVEFHQPPVQYSGPEQP